MALTRTGKDTLCQGRPVGKVVRGVTNVGEGSLYYAGPHACPWVRVWVWAPEYEEWWLEMVIGGIGPKVDRFDWGWGLNGETLEVELVWAGWEKRNQKGERLEVVRPRRGLTERGKCVATHTRFSWKAVCTWGARPDTGTPQTFGRAIASAAAPWGTL